MSDFAVTEDVQQCSGSFEDEQVKRLTDQLMKTKMGDLRRFRESSLGQGESDEELLDLLDATSMPRDGLRYHYMVTIILLFLADL